MLDISNLTEIVVKNYINISENECPYCGGNKWYCYRDYGDNQVLFLEGWQPLIDVDVEYVVSDHYDPSSMFDECVNCSAVIS